MQKRTVLFFICLSVSGLFAQGPLTVHNEGGNKKASVSEHIGPVKVTISYDRPGVKGREGKIWNTNVAHYGLADLGFGTSAAAPWRAGANENTTIAFSHGVKVEGKDLAAGTYGFHIILGEKEDLLIFSRRNNSWGSFYYDQAEDVLRVPVAHQQMEKSVEWLKYEFTGQTENSAVVTLQWEHRLIPFKVEADVHALQLQSFKNELKTKPGFTWQSFVQAANYCLDNGIEPRQALEWADQAITARFVGQRNFQTLSTRARALTALRREAEAKAAMDQAVGYGNVFELHQYARSLVAAKKPQEALAVFKLNYKKNPDVFTTNVGLGRGYSAAGDYKQSAKYMRLALAQAPDDLNRKNIENLLKKLEKGTDIN